MESSKFITTTNVYLFMMCLRYSNCTCICSVPDSWHYSKCYLDVCAMAQCAVIVPDSRWHNGRLESSERYSDQQGRHASKDEAVTTCSVCRTV